MGGKSVTTELSYNEFSLSKGPCEAFQGEKRNNGELLKHLRIAEVVVLGDADGVPTPSPPAVSSAFAPSHYLTLFTSKLIFMNQSPSLSVDTELNYGALGKFYIRAIKKEL